MSGLAAIFHRDGKIIDRDAIWPMIRSIPYRGPDGMTIRSLGNVALGHAKMAITPEEQQEQQPVLSPRTGCIVCADARLDNRGELLARLPDTHDHSISDADLIVRAYETWGVGAFPRLLGDFAFVLWDPRVQRLLCVRDTSGQRSLVYRADTSTFAAASEVHQLFQDPTVPIRPNDAHIRSWLTPVNMFRNEKDSQDTYYEGIHALPAGHALSIDQAALRVWKYWELDSRAELHYRTDDEYAEHYRALLFDVVQARLRSAHPVGALLSGGLDSSSIVCTAQQLYRARKIRDHGFVSFSFVFGDLDCDEQTFVQDMQRHYGFDARLVSPGTLAGRLQLEPQGFREAPNMGVAEARDAMCAAAGRADVRVLLSGDIGDSCVQGSRLVFDSLLRQGDLAGFRRHLHAYRRVSNESLHKILGLYCLAPLLPLDLQKRVTGLYARRALARSRPYLLPPWIPESTREDLAERHMRICLESEWRRQFSNDAREAELRLLYPPEIARHPVPWPVEISRPFSDRRLHEFLLAIPPEQKFEPDPETDEFYAGSKRLVRRAMNGIVPENVRTRKTKTVFSSVWQQEITGSWPVYEAAFGPAARPEIAERGYVDQARFWTRLQEARDGMQGNDLVYLFEMVGLETWLRVLRQPREQLVHVAAAHTRADQRAGTRTDIEALSGTAS